MPQRRHVARAAVSAVAATACLSLATPVWASSTTPLHSAHKGSTAAGFKQECTDNRFTGRPANQDGWHFVLPGGPSAGNFESIKLTFDTGGGNSVNVTIPDATDPYEDAFYSAGGRVIHAYLFTPAGWTLRDGTATVSGKADKFNLSHTCAGTAASPSPSPSPSGSPSPSESPSEPTPSETPEPSETPSESITPTPSPSDGSDGGEGGLPLTGVAATSIALVGLGLIGGGTLLVLRRRRDNVTFTS